MSAYHRGRSGGPSGFSLIELIITTAIIAILATIAIPQWLSLRKNAMRAEATANLPAVLLSQRAHLAEYGTYTDDLSRIAWRPEGAPRFLYGFVSDEHPDSSGLNDTAELRAAGYGDYETHNMVDLHGIPLTESNLPSEAVVTHQTVTVGAVANLDHRSTLSKLIMPLESGVVVRLEN